tara:strand:- start:1822 stop:3057 length:1236 start_codon:yes stop_codon:yes gene_type:complete
MDRVIVLVDYYLAAKFFVRMAKSDPDREYVFIANSLASHVFIGREGFSSILLSKFFRACKNNKKTFEDLVGTREVALGIMRPEQALMYLRKVLLAIDELLLSGKKNYLLTWNGSNVLGRAMRIAKGHYDNVETLFFELANVKGKVFADPKGVNADSSLYESPQLLDSLSYSDIEFERFKKKFKDEKLRSISIPPQVVSAKKIKLYKVLDYIYFMTIGYCSLANTSFFNRLLLSFNNRVDRRLERLGCETGEILDKEKQSFAFKDGFIFFPMQVSTDTQVVLNSDYDNYQVIDYLVQTEKLPIVIKPHPYECETKKILNVLRKYKGRVFFSNENTYKLIDRSEYVVTINSTVGMEAMLFGKKVKFMGRTFFSHFDHKRLASYLMRYLISVDFFDDDKFVSKEVMREVYGRDF